VKTSCLRTGFEITSLVTKNLFVEFLIKVSMEVSPAERTTQQKALSVLARYWKVKVCLLF
jgi:hypothetical protein